MERIVTTDNQMDADQQMWTVTAEVFSRVPLDASWPPGDARLDTTGSPAQYRWLGGNHPLTRQRAALALPTGPASVAVIDWSAARNTVALFDDARTIADPFVAILDLATVVGALIFYDHLLLLDYGGMAARLAQLFELGDVVHGLNTADYGDSWEEGMPGLIEKYFQDAQMELEQATDGNDMWVSWLRESWAELLPHAEFPRHDHDAHNQSHGHYNAYAGRTDVAFDALFRLHAGAYQPRQVDFNQLILDNDARSLFYEILVEQLRIHLDPARLLTFRYLANPLRTPMQAARARLAEAELRALRPAAEDWLQAQWAQLQAPLQVPPVSVRMPFWLGVVLSAARTRQDIPGAVRELRRRSRRFRERRRDIEEDLFAGDLSRYDTMRTALQGDVNALTENAASLASAALDIADTAAKVVLPLPLGPKSAAALVAPVSANWFRRQWLRLFRPQLWLMYDLGQQAQRVTRVLPVIFERFDLQPALAIQPTEFVARVGRITAPM
jgi:hypothetical protein